MRDKEEALNEEIKIHMICMLNNRLWKGFGSFPTKLDKIYSLAGAARL